MKMKIAIVTLKKRITPFPQVVGDGRHYEFGDDVDFSKFVTFY